MLTKNQFLDLKNRRSLSKAEQNRRWESYKVSVGRSRRGQPMRNTGFRVSQEGTAAAALLHTFPPCAVHYLQAQKAPFGLTAPVCVPSMYNIPSKKTRNMTRLEFSTGTNGKGYCVVNPWCMANNSTLATCSNSTFSQTIVAVSGTQTNSTAPTRLPYTVNDFTNGVRARVVGCGVRIRYIGPALARSGSVCAYRSLNNDTVGGEQLDDILNHNTARVFSVSGDKWTYLMWEPVQPAEYEFSDSSTSYGGSTPLCLIFYVFGTADSNGNLGPASFQVEVVQHLEYIGNIDGLSKSHSAIDAVSKIRNASSYTSSTQNPNAHLAHAVNQIGSEILEHSPPSLTQDIHNSPAHSAVSKLLSGAASTAAGAVGTYALGSTISNAGSSLMSSLSAGFHQALPWLTSAEEMALPVFEEAAPLLLAL